MVQNLIDVEPHHIPDEQSRGGATSDRTTCIHFLEGSVKYASFVDTGMLKHSNLSKREDV